MSNCCCSCKPFFLPLDREAVAIRELPCKSIAAVAAAAAKPFLKN
jgi:hypothetical protein